MTLAIFTIFIKFWSCEVAYGLDHSMDEWASVKASFIALTDAQKEEIRQPLVNELYDGFLDFIQIAKATELVSQYEEWYREFHGKIPEAGYDYWSTDKMAELTDKAADSCGEDIKDRYQWIIQQVNISFSNHEAAILLRDYASLPERRWIVTCFQKVREDL